MRFPKIFVLMCSDLSNHAKYCFLFTRPLWQRRHPRNSSRRGHSCGNRLHRRLRGRLPLHQRGRHRNALDLWPGGQPQTIQGYRHRHHGTGSSGKLLLFVVCMWCDTTSFLWSPLSKNKPNCIVSYCFLTIFSYYEQEVCQSSWWKVCLGPMRSFLSGWMVVISFNFLLQSSEFYWPFGVFLLIT